MGKIRLHDVVVVAIVVVYGVVRSVWEKSGKSSLYLIS